jgi:homoserine dehydrogenase
VTTMLAQFESSEYAAGKCCKVALLGFGTVGSCVARLLAARSAEYPLQLTHICNRNVARKRVDWTPPQVMWTEDIHQVLSSDADVIVELVGGLQPAYDWVRSALQSGKSVVTANKQLIAHFGSELLHLARVKQRFLGFGACVAGGVPVLSGLQDGLAGDRIIQIRGILNGTCNYILTRIEQAGASFAEALAEAQQAGFAECDPTDDVEGLDAGAKLAILARVGLNVEMRPQQVLCHSIRHIAAVDFDYAEELGCTIRQISTAKRNQGQIYAEVGPALVERDSLLARISGCQNLVVSTGEFGGETVFSGHGAGGNPTAVAVVSDLLQAARYRSNGLEPRHSAAISLSEPAADPELPHYLRFVVRDKPGILASLAGAFSRHQINVDAVLQRPGFSKSELAFVMTLEACPRSRLQAALAEIERLDFLAETPLNLPILK